VRSCTCRSTSARASVSVSTCLSSASFSDDKRWAYSNQGKQGVGARVLQACFQAGFLMADPCGLRSHKAAAVLSPGLLRSLIPL
jgi:hypothetical protein